MKKIKVDPAWVRDPSQWGVAKYGVTLAINPTVFPFFDEGCSVDVEDDEKGNFIGLGIYNPSDNTCYYFSEKDQACSVKLSKFIAHNGVSDLRKLQKWGFKIDESWLLWDTQLIGHILDSSLKQYGLKAMAKRELDIEYPSYEDLTGKKLSKARNNPFKSLAAALHINIPEPKNNHVTLDKLPLELVANYNAMDCYTTYKLYEKQRKDYIKCSYFEDLEKPVSFVVDAMEEKGILIDMPYLNVLKDSLEGLRRPLAEAITNELGPINLNSPKQLLGALNAKGIFPTFKNKASTDKRALAGLSSPIVSNLLAYSEIDTLLSSFVLPYLERGQEVVHPFFNQCGTRTGRLSCSSPNLQQIPKRTDNGKLVRKMFIARSGCSFSDCDFGQIEPRMLAHLSLDKGLLELFNKSVDFHTYTAERLSISRDRAKVLNLAVGYRATSRAISQQLKCSWDEAQKEIDKWWTAFPELYDWEQKLFYQIKKDGYLTTLLGRRIKVDGLDHGNEFRRAAAERRCIENIASGSAQEVMKLAMIKAHNAGITILVQVHDSILIEEKDEEIEAAVSLAIDCMQNCIALDVPLVVDAKIGKNWSEC